MKAARDVSNDDLRDIQGLVRSGFGTLRFAEYLFVDIDDRDPALAWLRRVKGRVKSVMSTGRNALLAAGEADASRSEAWSVAFTYRGLTKLGVCESKDAPFPSPFKAGQALLQRRQLLRDDLSERWNWGDSDGRASGREGDGSLDAVSILVIRMRDSSISASLDDLSDQMLARSGLRLVRRIIGDPRSFRDEVINCRNVTRMYEPFGFRDAIAQPMPRGLVINPGAEKRVESDRDMPLGEFVLGHRNLFGEIAHCPRVVGDADGRPAFGRNGSYLAIRQIHQFVAELCDYEAAHVLRSGSSPSVTEKMLGRFRTGAPLQTCPAPLKHEDDFGFLMNDSKGFDCPPGAHIRRANPRDGLSSSISDGIKSSRLHSMLRRGRPYLPESGAGSSANPAMLAEKQSASGLLFIALVADIVRQFEFAQRQWIANSGFGGLRDSRDPIVGSLGTGQMSFPGHPVGERLRSIPKFTQTLGGGYFFLPGLSTLGALADGHFSSADEGSEEPSAIRTNTTGSGHS